MTTLAHSRYNRLVDDAPADLPESTNQKAFPGIPAEPRDHDLEGKGGFEHFGSFAKAVIDSRHGPTSAMASYMTKAPQGLNVTGGDSEGGFLVPPTFQASLWDKVRNESEFLNRTTRYTTSGNSFEIPYLVETSRADGSRYGGCRSYWMEEAEQITKSQPKFGRMKLNLHKVACLVYVTSEMMEDSAFSIDSWLTMLMAKELNFRISDALFNGSGVGRPVGLIGAPAVVSVAKEQGQAANSILYDNITKMWSRLYPTSQANSAWYCNVNVFPELANMGLPVGTGGTAAYLPANGLSGSPYGTLMGRPIIYTEFNPTLGTVGDLLLADMSQYAVVTKGTVQTAMSMHLRFDYDELAFRATMRIDGQPLWNSALTPFKGTETQSPFVTLATRS